jgi:predicted RNA-binding Zn-ribbon protein involved in translation (DUF1610 family)
VPLNRPPGQYQGTPVQYDAQQDVLTAKAQAAATRQAANHCPECGSGDYVKVGTGMNERGSFDVMRCYACGWPLMQTGSGASTSRGATSTPAQQPASGGFNPTTIVDRIS